METKLSICRSAQTGKHIFISTDIYYG